MASATSIRATLENKGFERTSDPLVFQGKIRCGHKTVSVRIRVSDDWFVTLPEVYIVDRTELPDGANPHLEEGDRLCIAHPGTLRLDPYDAGRSILSIIKRAEAALEDSFAKRSAEAIADEYTSYWPASVRFYFVEDVPMGVSSWIQYRKDRPNLLRRLSTQKRAPEPFAKMVRMEGRMRPIDRFVSPGNVQELSEWWEHNGLNRALPFKDVSDQLQKDCIVFAMGENAILGARLGPRPLVKGRSNPDRIPRKILQAHKLTYAVGQEAGPEFISRRCIGPAASTTSPLAGLKIGLIGCGTIGSQLAPLLARSGAGAGRGELVLVDPEHLTPANLGRHTGRLDDIGRHKAEIVAEQVRAIHSELEVQAYSKRAEEVWSQLDQCHLLIDASGIENLSEWLNYKHISEGKKRHVVYAWIVQEGAAVQTFSTRYGQQDACFRCLRPDLEGNWRSSPLKKPDRDLEFVYGSCGDGAYVPFSAGTSACAASLALQAVLDAASGSNSSVLMTRVTNFDLAKEGESKNRRLTKSNECPACREQ